MAVRGVMDRDANTLRQVGNRRRGSANAKQSTRELGNVRSETRAARESQDQQKHARLLGGAGVPALCRDGCLGFASFRGLLNKVADFRAGYERPGNIGLVLDPDCNSASLDPLIFSTCRQSWRSHAAYDSVSPGVAYPDVKSGSQVATREVRKRFGPE